MYQLDLNIFNLTITASVFIGLIFSLLLIFTKRINQNANRYLGFLSLIIVCWNIWVLSLDLDIFRYYPTFYLIPLNFSLALGPLLYFYVKKMTTPSFQFSFKKSIHFIPLLLELIVHAFISIEALRQNTIATNTASFFVLIPIVQFFAIISILSYSYTALRLIRKYHHWLKENYSHDDKYNLRWLYRLISIFGILWLMLVPYTFVDYFFYDFNLGIADYYPIYILLSFITLWISIEAFLKPEVILIEPNITVKKTSPEKKETTDKVKTKAIWLTKQMETNLFYLDSELTLKKLAAELKLHPHVLSKIINDGLGKPFSDFVNEYRVQAVINRFNDPKYQQITLLGISFDCGFNSKTTFNRVFKNMTGKTPLEYKKSTHNPQ